MTTATLTTLREALSDKNAIKRIVSRRPGATRCRTVTRPEIEKLLSKLIDMNGDFVAGRWSASYDTCKALGYATILVSIEGFEEC